MLSAKSQPFLLLKYIGHALDKKDANQRFSTRPEVWRQ